MLKAVLREAKVARVAPQAVSSHSEKMRLGGHFYT
jgi:hypothetical protein